MVIDNGVAVSVGSALIIAIIGGVFKANAFATKVDSALASQEKKAIEVDSRLATLEGGMQTTAVAIGEIRTTMEYLKDSSRRIETAVIRLMDERGH